MDIKHSRRILCVGAPGSRVLDVIKDLTGTAPAAHANGSVAGLTHEWDVNTAYYTAKVPVWVDEIPDVKRWKEDFMKPEAKEVVEVVGAWVYCFPKPNGESLKHEWADIMKSIQSVVEQQTEDMGTNTVMLAVALPRSSSQASHAAATNQGSEELEDLCLDYGFEYIDYAAKGKNEYGEKAGFERLKEALEANEWTLGTAEDAETRIDDLDFDQDEDVLGGVGNREEAEMTAELFGMKAALMGEENDFDAEADDLVPPAEQAAQVDDLDRMMGKLMAVKEQSAELPEEQRKRMAARAVKELMKGD